MQILALDFGLKTGYAVGHLADAESLTVDHSGTQSQAVTKRSQHLSSFSAF